MYLGMYKQIPAQVQVVTGLPPVFDHFSHYRFDDITVMSQ